MKQLIIARSMLGVPWRHQGRDPAVGIDCAGLLELAYEVTPDNFTVAYGRHPHGDLITKRMEFNFGPAIDDEPRVGDAVTLGFGFNGVVRHVGIIGDYIHGGLSIIHTDSVVGRVVEHPFDEKWRRRVRGVYRRQEVTA